MKTSKNTQTAQSSDTAFTKPFFVVLYLLILLIYVASLINTPALHQPWPLVLFTLLVLLHSILHLNWLIQNLFSKSVWRILYFLIQGALIFAIGTMNEMHGFTIGLYMGMAGEAVGVFWQSRRDTIISGMFFFALTSLNTLLKWGLQGYLDVLPLYVLMFLFVYTYVIAFMRQSEAREHTQTLLSELEAAHQKLSEYASRVEELTITQERQRMARELHDTLAQGLAGLIMQLEAIDSHLENSNTSQAQAVTQQAMQRARTTLGDARRAIQDLRTNTIENDSIGNTLGSEIDQFSANTGIHTVYEIDAQEAEIPASFIPDILRILQEALRNISHHATARNVLVRLETKNSKLRLTIQDDGMGFDLQEALQKPGRFGLAGMQERAQKLSGQLIIDSKMDKGTRIQLELEI